MSRELDKAAALRRAFDESFARPPATRADDHERLLSLRIGAEGYAFRLGEISGFVVARKIVSLASTVAGALGLAGIRGSLVPVYSLAALLGHGGDDEAARWFVLCGAPDPIALAFAQFDGYLEVPRRDLHAVSGPSDRGPVATVARTGARNLGIIGISTLMETISVAVVASSTTKEQ
ncbi:MAG: chemotaxis protein CheW [bacterium]|nr:chemotaxis protein CheW [bacterium]